MIFKFQDKPITQVIIVTGMSGAGKNVVMRVLEDLGFYCVDNLPVPLVSTFLQFALKSQDSLIKIALGLDVRGKRFVQDLMRELECFRDKEQKQYEFRIIFLNASVDILVKRFQETRRAHPLGKGVSVLTAIESEKKLLEPVVKLADTILDTDNFNIHELRNWARESFSDLSDKKILVNLISFGFKYGVPTESSVVFDVRFLPNPYFIPALKAHDGREQIIQDYLFGQKEVVDCWTRIKDFVEYSIQKYYQEGRPFVNIAVGCTGGKHRSVTMAERLSKLKLENASFLVNHRDVTR